jgi:hypothetical protein
MAIAKKPESNTLAEAEKKAAAFISRTGEGGDKEADRANKKPTIIRIPPDLLRRIDGGAKRLGISRSAFIVQSAAEKLERMDQ